MLRLKKKPKATKRSEYATIVNEIMQGEIFSSSAGGEQPKFTAFNHELQSHVIVKFSPKGESWLKTGQKLVQLKYMQTQHLSTIKLLHAFGSLINNTDMHLGNLSFTFDKKQVSTVTHL